jgi:hypothetical protein
LNGPDDSGTPAVDQELERLKAENDELRASVQRRIRWRQVLTVVLVVLTSVSVVATSVAIWAHQVVFDTDRFMATVEPVLDDPDFYVLIGDRASDSVLEVLNAEARLAESLASLDVYLSDALADALDIDERARQLLQRFDRPSLSDLAPPIAAAVEARIDGGIHSFFSSEAFVSGFPELVRRSHEVAVALARDELSELPNVYVAEGEVRLNLIPFMGEALRRIADQVRSILPDFDLPEVLSDRLDEGREQLETALQANLPEDFGQVTVMSESALSEVQGIAVQLDRYVWVAAFLALGLLIAALAVSPNRRRTAIHLGVGIFVAVAIGAVAVRRLQSAIVAEIADPGGAALASEMVSGVLSGLRSAYLLIAVAAGLGALIAYLAGGPAWFGRLTARVGEWTEPAEGGSQLDRWIAGHAGPLKIVGVLIAVGVFFLIGLDLISIIIIGLLLAGYLWAISSASGRAESGAVSERGVSADVE